jgi:hypothetical protein
LAPRSKSEIGRLRGGRGKTPPTFFAELIFIAHKYGIELPGNQFNKESKIDDN